MCPTIDRRRGQQHARRQCRYRDRQHDHGGRTPSRARCVRSACRRRKERIGAGGSGHRRDHQGLRGHLTGQGLFAPAGTLEADRRQGRRRGRAHLVAARRAEAARECGRGFRAVGNPEAFTAFTRAERVKWGEVVKASGVKIETAAGAVRRRAQPYSWPREAAGDTAEGCRASRSDLRMSSVRTRAFFGGLRE